MGGLIFIIKQTSKKLLQWFCTSCIREGIFLALLSNNGGIKEGLEIDLYYYLVDLPEDIKLLLDGNLFIPKYFSEPNNNYLDLTSLQLLF